jgi:hypothetical protein
VNTYMIVCSVLPLVQIFIIFLYYSIELLSFGNGINFALVYLLNKGLKSDSVGRSALPGDLTTAAQSQNE